MQGVVIGVSAELIAIFRQFVPLLASHFTSLATDAKSGVGKEAFGHSLPFLRPGSIVPVKAFDS